MTAFEAPPFIRTPRPKKILIIGGGVAGLATLKTLVGDGGDGHFDQIELVERRDNIGGVWYLDDEVVREEKASLARGSIPPWPLISSHVEHPCKSRCPCKEEVSFSSSSSSSSARPAWPSPAYPGLRGNVLPRFLTLAGGPPFPPVADAEDPFPTLAETQAYLEVVAQPLRQHIRCNVECLDVRELPVTEPGKNRWAVRLRDWTRPGGPAKTRYFDAVVLTVGWTDVPAYPRLPGLEAAKRSGLVEHCKGYRGPEAYSANSRIVVVGNANSGNDVAAQLAGLRVQGQHEAVYRVARHRTWDYIVSLAGPMIEDIAALQDVSLDDSGKTLHLTLADGTILRHVDRIIFATGYQVAKIGFVHLLARMPLSSEWPLLPCVLKEDEEWTVEGARAKHPTLDALWMPLSSPPLDTAFPACQNFERIHDLFWQFLHARAATLATVNLCPTRIPFWTSDVQAHCLRAIWDGSMTLFPDTLEQRLEYQTRRLRLLIELKSKEPERVAKASERNAKESWGTKYIAPEHAATPSYHSLGLAIDDYGPPLRRMAITAKPQWKDKLPDWDLHAKERKEMHELRRTALESRRRRGILQN